jgi:hypothetical protein
MNKTAVRRSLVVGAVCVAALAGMNPVNGLGLDLSKISVNDTRERHTFPWIPNCNALIGG